MIQVKVVESILSSLTWSVMRQNESSKRTDSLISTRKKSEDLIQEEDSVEYNIDTNDEIDPEALNLKSKLILNLSSREEKIEFKNILDQNFEDSSFNIETNLLGNYVKRGKTAFKVSRRENLLDLKIFKPTINHQSCKPLEEWAPKKILPLIIDRLKNDFQDPDNFVPRFRANRNWKPLFLTWVKEIKPADEEPAKIIQRRISSSVLEKPRIYSIGLKYFKFREYEKSRSYLKKECKELLWLRSLEKRKKFQIQPFSLYKSSFPPNSATIKSTYIHCSRSTEKAIKSLNIKSSSLIKPKYSLVPLHQIEGFVKNDSKAGKHTRGNEKMRKSSWKSIPKLVTGKKSVGFNSKKATTSSDEEELKNSRRKYRSVRKEKSTERLKIILPTENFDQESIIFYEDTLTEKLSQHFLRDEVSTKKNLFVDDCNSSKFCRTELRKLDMLRNFEQIIDYKNSKDGTETEILKNIKSRIDHDFEKTFRVGKKSCNCRYKINANLKNSDTENSSIELKKQSLLSTSRSSKRNLIESVDSGVLTDFSMNDHPGEMSFRSRNDSLKIEENDFLKDAKSGKRFPSFDSGSESSWSGDEGLSRKIEKAVKRFTEELILCERRIKARIRSKNMLIEDRDGGIPDLRRRRIFQKKTSKSSFVKRHETRPQDFSKTSLLSSEEDFPLSISSLSLPSFTDSEYEE